MKKTVIFAITAILVLLLCCGAVYAGSQTDLNEINSQISQAQQQLKAGKQEASALKSQLNSLNQKIRATQSEIANLAGDIKATQAKIAEAREELAILEAEMQKQNEELSARLRAMYKNGNVGFLDVLLGSSSITNFLTNMDRVQMIYDSDKEMLETLQQEHVLAEQQKAYLDSVEAGLQSKKAEQETLKASLQEDTGDVNSKYSEVAEQNELLEDQIDALNAEAYKLIEEIRKAQGGGAYVGGSMSWPVPGCSRITSNFGYRIHPIYKVNKLHTGIDIGCASGSKVVAANGGSVIKATYNSSYGNYIIIDHGGQLATLYAHNSKLLVSVGQTVSRGDTIAYSGSTGASTGPHLHFEVRVNGEYVNPLGYVSP